MASDEFSAACKAVMMCWGVGSRASNVVNAISRGPFNSQSYPNLRQSFRKFAGNAKDILIISSCNLYNFIEKLAIKFSIKTCSILEHASR